MGRKKLLKKLVAFLDKEEQKQRKHRKKLKDLLKQLKEKENQLKDKVEVEKDDWKRERLRKELDIIHAQREKGIKALRNG